MRIDGLTVCVNYSDLLARGIDRWAAGLDSLTVVTDTQDDSTVAVCSRFPNVHVLRTDVFYEHGAKFNKFAALSLAFKTMRDIDWVLVFDSDICPMSDWRVRIERTDLIPGHLYGAFRYQVAEGGPLLLNPSKRMPQGWPLGFFSLFHASDPNVTDPLFDLHWPHAGNGDTTFARRWPKSRQTIIRSVPVLHFGEERQNWCGRDKKDELRAILKQRRGHEDWQRERMKVAPTI